MDSASALRLLCVLAHPDDESMGTGGLLARYAAEGVATYLVCATRGERGWAGDPDAYPGPSVLGCTREAALRAAAATLGVREVTCLGYLDGELDQADAVEAIGITRPAWATPASRRRYCARPSADTARRSRPRRGQWSG